MTPQSGSYISIPLSGALMEYDPASDGFVQDIVSPRLETPSSTGSYYVIEARNMLAVGNLARAPGGAYAKIDYSPSERTYRTVERGGELHRDQGEAAQYDLSYDSVLADAMVVQKWVLRTYEKEIADTLFNRTNYPADGVRGIDLVTPWNNPASDPLADVQTQIEVMRSQGVEPDSIIMDRTVKLSLSRHPQLREAVRYVSQDSRFGELPDQAIEDYLGLRPVVPNCSYMTNNPGQTALTTRRVWDPNYVMIAKLAKGGTIPANGAMVPGGVCATFSSTREGFTIAVEVYEANGTNSRVRRVRHHQDISRIQPNAGFLIGGVTVTSP